MKDDKFKIIDKSGDRKYFTIVPNYIVNHSTIYEQAIYLYMKRVAGEEGSCWESPKNIAGKLGVDPKTIRKYQRKLVERGWIEIIGTHRKTKPTIEYRIIDLWELNTKYYAEKLREKERGNNTFSQRSGNESRMKEESAPLVKVPDGNKEELSKEDLSKKIENIYARYTEKINKFSHLTDKARLMIQARLKNFKENDLLEAIDRFSQNKWYVENNSHRGVAWFFDGDDRVDQFVNLPKAGKPKTGKYDHLITKS
jgi:DNA-binding transcriptional regulator YhcF (GntR family)